MSKETSQDISKMGGIPSVARSDSRSRELCDAELGWQMCAEARGARPSITSAR
jgi:hypothetical protein